MNNSKSDNTFFKLICCLILVIATLTACGSNRIHGLLDGDFQTADSNSSADQSGVSDPNFGIHAIFGWKSTPIAFRVDKNMNKKQFIGLFKAMMTWEMAIGKKLFNFVGIDERGTAAFTNLKSPLSDDIRGCPKVS